MSATEIIELIKVLPESEVAEIEAFLQERAESSVERKTLNPADRKALITKILREHEEDFRLLAQ